MEFPTRIFISREINGQEVIVIYYLIEKPWRHRIHFNAQKPKPYFCKARDATGRLYLFEWNPEFTDSGNERLDTEKPNKKWNLASK